MSIIDKFGIRSIPIHRSENWDNEYFCYPEDVQDLEEENKEMLKALIEFYKNERHPIILDIIKIASPKTTEEIKELIK